MKTQANFFIVLLIAGFALFAAVSSAPGDRMVVRIGKGQAAKTIDVQLANLQKKDTEVAIQHQDGTIFFSEIVSREDDYAKKLYLTGMPDGPYVCFVRNSLGQHVQSFRLEGEMLIFADRPEAAPRGSAVLLRTGYSVNPVIARIDKSDAKTIQLRLANLQQQDTRIRLITLGIGAILEQKISKENGFAQKFNLEILDAGAYVLSVESGKGLLVQHFRLNKPDIQMGILERLEPVAAKRTDLANN